MVVPDTELICEIMLVAEGFHFAKHLAKKFITLYSLCKEQLSRQVSGDFCKDAIYPTRSKISALPPLGSL